MKTKFLFLVPLFALTACVSAPAAKDPVHNPQGLNSDDLIRTQIAKMEAMQRDMERREQELKMQHLKELHQVQNQAKNQIINTNCKFFCF
jgi:septal ring factor EnvC (AmiA/AmiB activator)